MHLRLAATLVVALLSPLLARANPETGAWVNSFNARPDSNVEVGDTIQFDVADGTDSALFVVSSGLADLCFDPDVGGSSGAARVTLYRTVDPHVATINGSVPISVPIDNSDCVEIVPGTYWVEVTTGPSGGETAVVTVTGRGN